MLPDHHLAIAGLVATVTLDRPAVRNAFDEHLIAGLTATLAALALDPAVRVVVLTGAGASFSAGADLGWMRRMADYDEAANRADAQALAQLLDTLDTMPKPTVALVNGPAIGGGVGLVAACDVAIAADDAFFALSEVRLGLIPAVISPYVIAAIGPRAARRYFLTGERLSTSAALDLGLVHETVPRDQLAGRLRDVLDALLQGGPDAQRAAKQLVFQNRDLNGVALSMTVVRGIAERRASSEGREGVAAFLAKRKPAWHSS